MTKRNRVFAAILLAYAIGVGLLMWRLLADIDPRYRESAEESLVEVAHLVAAQIEQRWAEQAGLAEPAIDVRALEPLFRDLYARELDAEIFGFRKTRIELRLSVVDAGGRVVFDSLGRAVGADHSLWRDVKLALEGRYGARTTPDVAGDPSTAVMYIAVPLKRDGAIVGAVSVGKPAQSFGQFVEAARRKTLVIGATSVAAVALLVVLLSVWLVRPFGLIADYVRYVRAERSFSLPRLSRRALGALGAAYGEMRDALAGRNYVADYVQTLTHELKSPLSAIRGAAELLHEPSMPPADRVRFVANIERETARIQELVDRMMELAALESRRALDRTAPVAMRALLEERVASAQAAGAPRRIGVSLVGGDDAAVQASVDGDALLLQRAVGNLLDNALDFSPDGGHIEVTLGTPARRVEVGVRDHGPGIPDYADDKVFEKFYSLARPGTQRKSTGLGLPFVREIAELHGGRISLRNAEGGGALALLSLPRGAALKD
ncbi:MAG: two-component system sensor histidine kinase CreC [Pseudomonadota bacterium]